MTPYVSDPDFTLYVGDALEVLRELPDESVHCCVTSPPYWGLRDYGTGTWEGGDADCDHAGPPKASTRSGLKNDGRPSERVGQNDYERAATVPFRDTCGKCGATRSDHQLGLEPTPEAYVAKMVEVFREVRRVLRADGTCWINLGSSYASGDTPTSRSRPDAPAYGSGDIAPTNSPDPGFACRDLCDECLADYLNHRDRTPDTTRPPSLDAPLLAPTGRDSAPPGSVSASLDASPLDVQASTTLQSWLQLRGSCSRCASRVSSLSNVRSSTSDVPASSHMSWLNYTSRLKPKDMIPTPWMVAMSLQEDGWYLRSDIIWSKPNPMPESVTDRPTKAHEYVFLLSKARRYYFDAEAVREPHKEPWRGQGETERNNWSAGGTDTSRGSKETVRLYNPAGRNLRSVWEIATQPYPEAHFATFPEALVERCVKAGCPVDGTVLDPFMGSGTTALVARKLGRRSIGIELSPEYAELCARRLQQQSLFAETA